MNNSIWRLPTSVFANGKEYKIRTDYRDVIHLFEAISDPELNNMGQPYKNSMIVTMYLVILVPNYKDIPKDDTMEVVNALIDFLDMGQKHDKYAEKKPKIMDWSQDAPLIIPEINKTIGYDVRSVEYMHWWTFLGYYMTIGESTFSFVLNIRKKRLEGRKLEDYEIRWMSEHMDLIELRQRLTEEEQIELEEESKALDALLGG